MTKITRRDALKAFALPALAAAIAGTTTLAEAKATKAAMHYQDKPKGDDKCSGCRFFEKGKTAKAMGACTIVGGAISPNGWCIAYHAK